MISKNTIFFVFSVSLFFNSIIRFSYNFSQSSIIMTGAINIPTLYPASTSLLIASILCSNLDVPNSTLFIISLGLTLILTIIFPLWFNSKISSTIANLVGNVKYPFLASLKFSIVHIRFWVIVFSKIKSLLLPISNVNSFFEDSLVFIIFSNIFSLFTNSLKYAHLL